MIRTTQTNKMSLGMLSFVLLLSGCQPAPEMSTFLQGFAREILAAFLL